MRAFLAVELPEPLRQELAALQATLRASGADVKWVEPANLHLTLKFLGNIEDAQRSAISCQLSARCQAHHPFEIQLEGIGAFPSTRSPRVVWVGVSAGREPLVALAKTVEQACAGLGFPEERPFSAHLTIGRVRSQDRLASLIKTLQVVEFRGRTPASVDRLTLVQSILSPNGPIYTPLTTVPLQPP